MKKTTGTDRSITSKWRPATQAVRAGTWRSEQGETSEALFLTSGYTYDIDKCVAEIHKLAAAGADLVRVAVPERKDTDALKLGVNLFMYSISH